MLAQFMNRALSATGGQIRYFGDGPGEQRAFSQLTKPDESGVLREWFTACLHWPRAILICTCVARSGHSALAEAERMFASIAPATTEPPC